jgi:3-hydroxyisobutyrate dehydrogenase
LYKNIQNELYQKLFYVYQSGKELLMEIKQIAFVGLGVMGFPMAGHISNAGYSVKVYNRTQSKTKTWGAQYSGTVGTTPGRTAHGCDVVLMCLGNDNDVRSVFYGDEGILAGIAPGAVLVDHTTTSAELALELARECKKKGVSFIDAPVSGGQAGAENGQLTVMCGGQPEVFNQVRSVISSYAKQAELLGENGQGQRCKMVNQICIAGILQGLSEALQLAQKSHLDIEQVVAVLKHGAAGSWQMENRAVTMSNAQFNFGFAIDWMRKDLGFCLNEAQKHQLELPLTQAVDQMYAVLQQQGMGRLDTSALIKAYDHLTIPTT